MIGVAQRFRVERGEITFYGCVQLVEDIIEPLDLADLSTLGSIQGLSKSMQHAFHEIGHAESFPGRAAKRHDRRFAGGRIKIEGP